MTAGFSNRKYVSGRWFAAHLVIRHWVRTIGAVLALWFITGTALAANAYHGAQLKSVYPLSDGSFVLVFMTDTAACSSTNSPKYFYVTAGQNGVTADGVKNMLAAALTAFALEKLVYIAFDDATPSCYINRLSVER
jgi:hypothetical protein